MSTEARDAIQRRPTRGVLPGLRFGAGEFFVAQYNFSDSLSLYGLFLYCLQKATASESEAVSTVMAVTAVARAAIGLSTVKTETVSLS
jgi:hypothetical protein